MSKTAQDYNQAYIKTMLTAPNDKVLGRLRDLWWDNYILAYDIEGYEVVLKKLDSFMNKGRGTLHTMASDYATSKGETPGSSKHMQKVSQFLKSNTGKMFERFIGLSIAHALYEEDASYCVVPFTNEWVSRIHGLTKNDLSIKISIGGKELSVPIDSDLIAFDPDDSEKPIYMISVKSTLKDRFHNVPFWNLLRRCAISSDFPDITALNPEALKRVKYVAACTDLAEEQADFRSLAGPRRLLQIDAALLDGAYISSENAQGIPIVGDHMGAGRSAAFHNLNRFVDLLLGKS